MQTKQQIKALLDAADISPKKSLAQHYLIDMNLMRVLLDTARICSSDVVLEVGCGTGSLTEEMAEKAGRCIAVELDKTLANIAKNQLAQARNVDILNTDILQSKHTLNPETTNLLTKYRERYKGRVLLVSNLPYNIATPLMINLIKGRLNLDAMYVTVQKQLAQRMTAKPGSGHYGALTIYLKLTGTVKTIRTLKPTVFWPQPRVESVMVSYQRSRQKTAKIQNINVLSDIVKFFMAHRRKMLKTCIKLHEKNKLKINNWLEIFKQASIKPSLRPEQLTPQNYLTLANLYHRNIKAGEKK